MIASHHPILNSLQLSVFLQRTVSSSQTIMGQARTPLSPVQEVSHQAFATASRCHLRKARTRHVCCLVWFPIFCLSFVDEPNFFLLAIAYLLVQVCGANRRHVATRTMGSQSATTYSVCSYFNLLWFECCWWTCALNSMTIFLQSVLHQSSASSCSIVALCSWRTSAITECRHHRGWFILLKHSLLRTLQIHSIFSLFILSFIPGVRVQPANIYQRIWRLARAYDN